jgi:hypothetical protein
MAIRYGLALAAVVLAMAASNVRACDDFEEEMALAGAREAVQVGQAAVDGQAQSLRVDAPASGQPQSPMALAAEPGAAPTEPSRILAR